MAEEGMAGGVGLGARVSLLPITCCPGRRPPCSPASIRTLVEPLRVVPVGVLVDFRALPAKDDLPPPTHAVGFGPAPGRSRPNLAIRCDPRFLGVFSLPLQGLPPSDFASLRQGPLRR